jgi:hypothetical protein
VNFKDQNVNFTVFKSLKIEEKIYIESVSLIRFHTKHRLGVNLVQPKAESPGL